MMTTLPKRKTLTSLCGAPNNVKQENEPALLNEDEGDHP